KLAGGGSSLIFGLGTKLSICP
uniref:Uncharacterized protein n=1 Tax=Sarcophilus harrisii TaxID=9305 RepID=A0A7N4P5Z3_SARHA